MNPNFCALFFRKLYENAYKINKIDDRIAAEIVEQACRPLFEHLHRDHAQTIIEWFTGLV